MGVGGSSVHSDDRRRVADEASSAKILLDFLLGAVFAQRGFHSQLIRNPIPRILRDLIERGGGEEMAFRLGFVDHRGKIE